MIPIAICQGIYYKTGRSSLNPLIIGSTITSIITFIKNILVQKLVSKATYKRSIIMVSVDILIFIMLVLLYQLVDLKSISLSIFLGIDIGLYFVFNILKELSKGWSRFGLNLHCKIINYNALLLI